MNRHIILPLFFSLILSLKAFSQLSKNNVPTLSVGKQIPADVWNIPFQVVNNLGEKVLTLGDFKGKLIILDFWATWCGSCIAAMPRIHELEKKFAEDMVIVPISHESAEKVSNFIQTNHVAKSLDLFSIVNGKVLQTMFPHKYIPHFVWISKTGEVAAITTSERITEKNIERLLEENNKDIPMVKDINPSKPLLLSPEMDLDDLTQYSVLTKGNVDGLPTGNRFRRQDGIVRGRAITNSSIISIYKVVAHHLFEKNGESLNSKRFIVDISDTSKLSYNYVDYDSDRISNRINYEMVVPVHLADSLYNYMLEDLNKYTSFIGRIEKRRIKCLFLKRTRGFRRTKSVVGKMENTLFHKKPSVLKGYALAMLTKELNELSSIPYLVIDETGYKEPVDLEFSGMTDLEAIKKELYSQGLDLVEGYTKIDMFVLGDK